jgi:PAS domain-containing protein
VPGLALDQFETQVEAFLQARSWREHQFRRGLRPGRGLVSLYESDFPDLTSNDLWDDLQAATPEDPRQLARLSALLAAAHLEGQTRDFAVRLTRLQAVATVVFEDETLPWREASARWPLLLDVPRRHALEEAWRGVLGSEITPILERWQETLRSELVPLGSDDWLEFWSNLHGINLGLLSRLSTSVLDQTADVYGHGLGVYLGQLELPIDDVWRVDVDWAFRAPRFDTVFAEQLRMPALIRAMRDLGIELEEQTQIMLEPGIQAGVDWLPLEVPKDTRVLVRLIGGWQDLGRTLSGVGPAEHVAHTDATLRVWERWLGDSAPTLGYGYLLAGLLRDPNWLAQRMEYVASEDFRVITHLEWLYRVRRVAALAAYEQRLWQAEPGASMAADFEEALSIATRVRHFPEEYLGVLLGAPWSTLHAANRLRAEVFAAQLRLFLKREFDEEWWRSARAAHFIKDELWRPGRRHSADELLGYMGFEGFDPAILTAEFVEVLQPL